mgnify:CR=1 FL=1
MDFRNSVNTSRELALITTYPALFVSHGAPDIVISGHPAATALRDLGQQFAAPRAILMISAHWLTDPVTITCGEAPETIHDFGGFPKPLYQIQYPAMGDSRLATEIAGRLETVGIAVRLDRHRGLDHGAWTPLLLMYPDANVPVVQISLPASDLDACARLGEALAPLRKKRNIDYWLRRLGTQPAPAEFTRYHRALGAGFRKLAPGNRRRQSLRSAQHSSGFAL